MGEARRRIWSIGWRSMVLLPATVLYGWAGLEFVFRRTCGRALVGEGLTEKQMASVVEVITRPVVSVFWVTALYLLLWVVVVVSWVATRRAITPASPPGPGA